MKSASSTHRNRSCQAFRDQKKPESSLFFSSLLKPVYRVMTITEEGLVLGAGTVLAKWK